MYGTPYSLGDIFYTFLILPVHDDSTENGLANFKIHVRKLELLEFRIGRSFQNLSKGDYGPDTSSDISFVFSDGSAFRFVANECYLVGHDKFLDILPRRLYPKVSQLFQTTNDSKSYRQAIIDTIRDVMNDKVGRIQFLV